MLLVPSIAFTQHTGMQFDGNGDYIKTAFPGIAGSGSRTVQCWFKGTSSSWHRFLVDMGNTSGGNGAKFSVKINSSTSVARIEIGTNGLSGTTVITNNQWHHITAVYDNAAPSNKYKIYINGVLDVQGDITGTLNTAATTSIPVTIGIRSDLSVGTELFGGMDDVRIWSIPLSAAQISANYNSELCGTPTGLAAYYKMNEGMASSNNTSITSLFNVVTPASVNTLYGFTLTGNSSNYNTHILATVNNTASTTASSCSPYFWSQSGTTYSSSGTYTHTVPLSPGCDSTYTLNLTITPPTQSFVTVSKCTTYVWPQNGQSYSVSGSYNDTVVTAGGCDSIVTLNLTINPVQPTTTTQVKCVSYLWPQTGMTYTTSGTYSHTVTSSGGCDSILYLNLTIKNASSATQTVNACANYTWPLNGNTYTTSGTYTHTLPNAAGCDSNVQLFLTINNVSIQSSSISACSNYTWSQNNVTYTSSGTYYDTLTASTGCDSIIELVLTLFSNQNTISNLGNGFLTANISPASYQWINCSNNSAIPGATSQSFAPSVSGSYAVVVQGSSCTDTSNCELVSNVGLSEQISNNFAVYPNPSTSGFWVEAIENANFNRFLLMDINGKIVLNGTADLNTERIYVDASNLNSGVYYLRVYSANQMETNLKWVKQ